MNWTGGRLQRSRHAGTSLSALQKNHFAKARTRLQNGPLITSPLNFPIFVIAKEEGRGLPEYQSLLASEIKANLTQRTLEGYHNTAALAKRLGSIKHRRSLDDARSIQPHGQRRRSRTSNHEGNLNRHLQAVTTKIESGPNRLYGMTQGLCPERSLEAKRRELLQRQDWVKAAISKPLKMDFVEDKTRERIGKRRRLREDDHECRRGMRNRTSIPPIDERANIEGERLPPYHLHHDTISVRVGTSIHGSQRTREEKDFTSQQSRRSDLSDPMLLDAEDVTQRYYRSSQVTTPFDCEKDFSADAPSSLETNPRMPICVPPRSSPGRELEKRTTRLLSLNLSCSSPTNTAVTTDDINGSNSVAAVDEEAAPPANNKTYFNCEAESGEALGRLIFASSPYRKRSSTPSATLEVASRLNTRAHGSGSAPRAEIEVENGTNDACWKNFLDISDSSTINQNIDASPLSQATSQNLAALRNGTKAETVQPLAVPPEDDHLVKYSFLPRLTTAHHKRRCTGDSELVKSRNMSVSKSDYSGSNSISNSRDEDSLWRDFVFGDEMDADNSHTYERHDHQNDFSRSRNQLGASSVLFQASSEDTKEAISTSSTSRDSPSSNSYLMPALPPTAATSSPDPLNHLTNSTGSIDPKQTRRLPGSKLLFTKPAPFVGRRAMREGSAFRIGQRLGRSAMTWRPQSPANDVDIIDD